MLLSNQPPTETVQLLPSVCVNWVLSLGGKGLYLSASPGPQQHVRYGSPTTQLGEYCYCSHVKDRDTEAKTTPLVRARARIQKLASQAYSL